jgi:hypothetical protein
MYDLRLNITLVDKEVYVKLEKEECVVTKKVKGLSRQIINIQEKKDVMARTIRKSSLIRVYKCKLEDIQVLLGYEDAAKLRVKLQGITMTFPGI